MSPGQVLFCVFKHTFFYRTPPGGCFLLKGCYVLPSLLVFYYCFNFIILLLVLLFRNTLQVVWREKKNVILIHLPNKKLWWILTKPIDLKLEMVPSIIYKCFVLHNFCQTKSPFWLGEGRVKAHMEQSFDRMVLLFRRNHNKPDLLWKIYKKQEQQLL